MNVLSLFDGISCCRLALERAGIEVENYYASEIEDSAIKIAQHNYPDTIQLGSVLDFESWDIDWGSIDLITGGFPCQAWSVAGKQLGDKDERGMLFWTMLDVMKKVRKYNKKADFLIENVKMKKEFEEYITFHTKEALVDVHKILINSALVSAQNRDRYYWTSFEVKQPEDKGINLSDIIESGYADREKSYCLDANYNKGGNLKRYFYRSSRQLIFEDKEFLLQLKKQKPNILEINKIGSINKTKWRLLNLTELERLQCLPIGYTSCVAPAHAKKAIGNGWTVDVIAHILKGLKRNAKI